MTWAIKNSPIVVGIICFVIAVFILKEVFGPAVCRDGWKSLSIGISGACSHHGGVASRPVFIIALLFGGVGWFAMKRFSESETKQRPSNWDNKSEPTISSENDEEKPHNRTKEEILFADYKKMGGPLSYDEWVKAREWINDTDWSKRQDRNDPK